MFTHSYEVFPYLSQALDFSQGPENWKGKKILKCPEDLAHEVEPRLLPTFIFRKPLIWDFQNFGSGSKEGGVSESKANDGELWGAADEVSLAHSFLSSLSAVQISSQ